MRTTFLNGKKLLPVIFLMPLLVFKPGINRAADNSFMQSYDTIYRESGDTLCRQIYINERSQEIYILIYMDNDSVVLNKRKWIIEH